VKFLLFLFVITLFTPRDFFLSELYTHRPFVLTAQHRRFSEHLSASPLSTEKYFPPPISSSWFLTTPSSLHPQSRWKTIRRTPFQATRRLTATPPLFLTLVYPNGTPRRRWEEFPFLSDEGLYFPTKRDPFRASRVQGSPFLPLSCTDVSQGRTDDQHDPPFPSWSAKDPSFSFRDRSRHVKPAPHDREIFARSDICVPGSPPLFFCRQSSFLASKFSVQSKLLSGTRQALSETTFFFFS